MFQAILPHTMATMPKFERSRYLNSKSRRRGVLVTFFWLVRQMYMRGEYGGGWAVLALFYSLCLCIIEDTNSKLRLNVYAHTHTHTRLTRESVATLDDLFLEQGQHFWTLSCISILHPWYIITHPRRNRYVSRRACVPGKRKINDQSH